MTEVNWKNCNDGDCQHCRHCQVEEAAPEKGVKMAFIWCAYKKRVLEHVRAEHVRAAMQCLPIGRRCGALERKA